jgi:hypothetical protein
MLNFDFEATVIVGQADDTVVALVDFPRLLFCFTLQRQHQTLLLY